MKLKPIPQEEPQKRVPFTLKESLLEQLEEYRKFYLAKYAIDIKTSQLVGEMLTTFMKEDKEFARHLKGLPGSTATPAAPK